MTGLHTQYRILENGSIDYVYYDKRARNLRSEDSFRVCRMCKVALRTAIDRLITACMSAFRGRGMVTKHAVKSPAFHALAYVASSTGSSQSATAPSRPS